MAGRGNVQFAAFDIVWYERSIPRSRRALYAEICNRDMHGRHRLQAGDQSVSDHSQHDDLDQGENPKHTQAEGRRELFNQRRT